MIERIKRMLSTAKIVMRSEGEVLAIFVHGLGGSASGTWKHMLMLLAAEPTLNHVAFDCYAYPTSLLKLPFFSRGPGIRELASGLRTYISVHHPHKKKIVLIGHSLGGLVVRQYILDIFDTDERAKLAGALLYAVPNSGSAWAHINSAISWRHLQAKQLKPSSDLLDGLNKEWVRRQVESTVPVTYVIGGIDAVVAKESGAWSQGADHQTIIEHGHRSIIKPKNNNETTFKLLKEFIGRFAILALAGAVPKIQAQKNEELNADPLFDIYSENVEPYYEVRDVDAAIASATLGANLWVSGASGVGKTAALKRLAVVSEWKLEHVILASFQNMSPFALMAAICTQLYERMGMQDIIVSAEIDTAGILSHLEKIYNAAPSDKALAIFVEEIPLAAGEEYASFLELVYHITLATRGNHCARVIWMFSSIGDPTVDIGPNLKHFRERMQFIRIERWDDIEIRRLIIRIKKSGLIKISAPNVKMLVEAAKGIPRFVKMVLRRNRNEIGSRKPFAELIQSVQKDL